MNQHEWLENTGITPPLAPNTIITVQLFDNTFATDYLSTFSFSLTDSAYDIKKWKVFTQNKEIQSALDTQVSGNHYKSLAIQPVEYIQANNIGYLDGNVIKYITRHASKNGKEDVEKAIHYCQLILQLVYKDK